MLYHEPMQSSSMVGTAAALCIEVAPELDRESQSDRAALRQIWEHMVG
jgi:hypothetical protein